MAQLSDMDMPVAPIAFGQTDEPTFPVEEYPSGGWGDHRMIQRDLKTYELCGAIVHGEQGVVTVGDYVLKETLRLASLESYRARWEAGGFVSLATRELDISMPRGSYLFCGYPGNRNYAHWMVDILPGASAAFSEPELTLIWPKVRNDWQVQTLSLLNVTSRSVFLGESMSVRFEKLRITPLGLIDSGHFPHPDRMTLVNELKAQAGFDPTARRKIYISRRDTSARKLINENEVIELMLELGFEVLTLSEMSVLEQIKCFSEARCVVGPHGAGLANVMFCPPLSSFCELHMDNYVQWSMRRLASVVPLRYGCVIGREQGLATGQHQKKWIINPESIRKAVESEVS